MRFLASTNGRRPLKLLFEVYVDSLTALAQQCVFLNKHFCIDQWVAPCEDENLVLANRLHNLAMEQNADLDISPHPLPRDLRISAQIIRQRLKEDGLHLKSGGTLVDRIQAFNNEDPNQPRLEEKYPEILALANVVYLFDEDTFLTEDPDAWREEPSPEHLGRCPVGGY